MDIFGKEMFVVREGRRQEHVELLHNLNELEINEYESLLSVLTSILFSADQDQPIWSLSATEQFSIRTF